MVKAGLKNKDVEEILFIFKFRKLNTNISIGENGLKNRSKITVIYDVEIA